MYEYKEVYTLDFTNVKYYRQIHEIIEKELDFPSYYGGNWSAFWDCLTDMVGEDPLHIEIIGMDVIREKFDDTADMMINILRDIKHYDEDYEDDILIELVDGDTRTVIE